jgi:ribosomal protein L37E
MMNNECVEFKTILSCSDVTEAHIYKSMLENKGIKVLILDEVIGSMKFYYGSAVGGVRIQVPVERSSDALAILKQNNVSTDNSWPVICPRCGEESVGCTKKFGGAVTLIAALSFGVPAGLASIHCLCERCGYKWVYRRSALYRAGRTAVFLVLVFVFFIIISLFTSLL